MHSDDPLSRIDATGAVSLSRQSLQNFETCPGSHPEDVPPFRPFVEMRNVSANVPFIVILGSNSTSFEALLIVFGLWAKRVPFVFKGIEPGSTTEVACMRVYATGGLDSRTCCECTVTPGQWLGVSLTARISVSPTVFILQC